MIQRVPLVPALMLVLCIGAVGCSSSGQIGAPDVGAGVPDADAGAPSDGSLPGDVTPRMDAAAVDDGPPDVGGPIDVTFPEGGDLTFGPDVAGPYVVTMSSTRVMGATAVAYVPTVPTGMRVPIVLFKHGFLLGSTDYAPLLQRIATHGFIVVGVDTPLALGNGPTQTDERDEIVHTLDWALGSAPFAPSADASHVAVMGHSRGGKDAVLAAAVDPRITAALLLDPVNGCGPGATFSATCPDATSGANAGALRVPVGVMGETNDGTGGGMPCAPLAENYATVYAALHAAPWAVEWTFADAVHMTFTDDGGGFTGAFCAAEPSNATTLRAEIHTMAVAFARYHLRGETAMAPWLTGAMVPTGVTRVGP